MSSAGALTLALAVVAGCAGALNLWVYWLRRQELGHLWLAVAAGGALAMVVPSALLYESRRVEDAMLFRELLGLAAVPLAFGLIRFTAHFLKVDLRRFERVAMSVVLLPMAASMIPGLLLTREPVMRELALFGTRYVDCGIGPAGAVLSGLYVIGAGWLFSLYQGRLAAMGPDGSIVLAAATVWIGTVANDVLVGVGVLETPFLMAVGYDALIIAFTAVLMRRFVESMERVEESTELLQRAAEQRTQALRERDLQLANAEALAAAGTLAAGLAHEINNPIAFISANLNQLDGLRREDDAEQLVAEVLEETREGIARIRGIVGELARMGLTGAGQDEPVDLRDVVESVLPIVRQPARGRAELHTRIAELPPVLGDRRLLGQVVLNLLLNAIQAIPPEEGGRVGVSAQPRGEEVWLEVSDSGPGIPDHVLPRVFEPFFTTKGAGEGTGLGLAVTRQLVERHGGRVEVETGSTGTTFRVRLPSAGGPRLAPTDGEAEAGWRAGPEGPELEGSESA